MRPRKYAYNKTKKKEKRQKTRTQKTQGGKDKQTEKNNTNKRKATREKVDPRGGGRQQRSKKCQGKSRLLMLRRNMPFGTHILKGAQPLPPRARANSKQNNKRIN